MLRYFKFVRAIDHYVYDRNATLIGMVPEPFRPGRVDLFIGRMPIAVHDITGEESREDH